MISRHLEHLEILRIETILPVSGATKLSRFVFLSSSSRVSRPIDRITYSVPPWVYFFRRISVTLIKSGFSIISSALELFNSYDRGVPAGQAILRRLHGTNEYTGGLLRNDLFVWGLNLFSREEVRGVQSRFWPLSSCGTRNEERKKNERRKEGRDASLRYRNYY